MLRQEQSGLSASRTGLTEKTCKKHEILAFTLLLQEIQLKNLTSLKIF